MTKKEIGKAFKKEMDARKWSVYKLAQLSGVKISPLQSIFKGETAYTIDSFQKICVALELKMNLT